MVGLNFGGLEWSQLKEEGGVAGKDDELVFDMEIGGSGRCGDGNFTEDVMSMLRSLSKPKNMFTAQLMFDLARLRADNDRVGFLDLEDVGSALASLGYTVQIRRTLGIPSPSRRPLRTSMAVFEHLRHTFIVVIGPKRDVIFVDPRFREQFAVARPTNRLDAFLETVPEVFVGAAEELVRTLDVVCGEVRLAFETQGMSVPPWRRKKSVASKWLSKAVQKEEIDSAGRKKDASCQKVGRILGPTRSADAHMRSPPPPPSNAPKFMPTDPSGRLFLMELLASNAA